MNAHVKPTMASVQPVSKTPRIDLEDAVTNVAQMARVAAEYLGQVCGLDKAGGHTLTEDEASQIMFLVTMTSSMAMKAESAFYEASSSFK